MGRNLLLFDVGCAPNIEILWNLGLFENPKLFGHVSNFLPKISKF